jgi:hypothetical protein
MVTIGLISNEALIIPLGASFGAKVVFTDQWFCDRDTKLARTKHKNKVILLILISGVYTKLRNSNSVINCNVLWIGKS